MLDFQKKLTNGFYSLLSLPATAMGFALSIQIAVLSWILKTQYGLDYSKIGIIWAAGPIAGVIGQVVVGFISDKVWFWGGRRRPFIIIGGTIATVMLLALPQLGLINELLGFNNLVLVAIVVALSLDLAINISFNPTRSLITDVTPEGEARTSGYTWMQTISGFFGVAAYIFGAIAGNYNLIYFGSIIVLLFSVVPIFFITEKKDLDIVDDENEIKSIEPKGAEWGQLIRVYLANGFSWFGVQTMFVFIIAFISQKVNPVPENAEETIIKSIENSWGTIIGYSFAVLNTIGFILPKFVFEPLTKKFGRIKIQAVALFVMSIGYLLILLLVRDSILLYILMAVVGIGWAAIVSLPFAIMSEFSDKRKMGFFMGIFNLSIVIPQLLVSTIVGGLVDSAEDKGIVFVIATISLLLSSFTWLTVKETYKKN